MTSELFGQTPTEVPAKPPVQKSQLVMIAGLAAVAITGVLIVGDLAVDTVFPSRPMIESMKDLANDTEGIADLHIKGTTFLDGGPAKLFGTFTLEPDLSAEEEKQIFVTVDAWADWTSFRYSLKDFTVTVERPGGMGVFTRSS
ncbi:hypothetical protein [Salinibacterium sp. ZJ450]|uniref:hypothetical protein n=1 Tax=Salinibacterium sp. ZJ450 TaxID=2708338 RepID=UPI0014203792|nr:hypothetical protein [Salinibacterium sp. ZJ450]